MKDNELEWLNGPEDFLEDTDLTLEHILSDEVEMPIGIFDEPQYLSVLAKRQTGGLIMFGYLGIVFEPNDSGRLLLEVTVPPRGQDFSGDAEYVLQALMQTVKFHHDAFEPLGSGILTVSNARVHPVDTRYSSWQLCAHVLTTGLDKRFLGEENYSVVSASRGLPHNLQKLAELARSGSTRTVRLAELCVENYCHYWGVHGEKLSFGLSSNVTASKGQEPGLAKNKLFFNTTAPGLAASKVQPAVLNHLREGTINEQYEALLWLVRHGDQDALEAAQSFLLGDEA